MCLRYYVRGGGGIGGVEAVRGIKEEYEGESVEE